MSMAKKRVKKKPIPVESFGGHRDLAERISKEYVSICDSIGWQVIDAMMDIDRLTKLLQDIPDEVIDRSIGEPWAHGFLMGMLHQSIVNEALWEMAADMENGEPGPEDDEGI